MMKNLSDLFYSEIRNLYALEKECTEIFNSVQESIKDQDLLQIAKDLADDSSKQYEELQETLRAKEINPGNTVDSVAQEMIDNIKEISSLEIPQEVKDEGILGSFNRMNYYRMACYENAYELAKKLKFDDFKSLLYYDMKK